MQERQWITARRSELNALAEELAKKLQEVQAERDELAIAERVSNRLAEQARADAGAVAPASAKVAGRAVLLIPHRSDAADDGALPRLPQDPGDRAGGRRPCAGPGGRRAAWAGRLGARQAGTFAGQDDQARRPRLAAQTP